MPDIPMDVYPRPQAIPSDSTYFKFPGAEVYVLMQRFVNAQCSAKSLLQHDAMTTWFSDWQVAHGRVSTLQIRVIVAWNSLRTGIHIQMVRKSFTIFLGCFACKLGERFPNPLYDAATIF